MEREIDVQSDNAEHLRLPDGRTLLWRVTGPAAAPVVLWLHGATGSSVTAPRSDAARVLSYDRPGFGGSSAHPGRDLLSDADDVQALLDHCDVSAAAILAFSAGAAAGFATAAVHGSRVRCLGIVSGSIWPTTPAPSLEQVQHAGKILLASPSAAIDRLKVGAPPRDLEALTNPALREQLVGGALDAVRTGIQGWVQEAILVRSEWPFAQDVIRRPVLWWHGELDPIVPIGEAEATVSALPDAVLHRLPGAGHFGWWLQREYILTSIT